MSIVGDCTSALTEDLANSAHHGWVLDGCVGEQDALSHVPIARLPFVIGRDPASDLCLDSRLVSKRHAELLATTQAVIVRDLGSTNGTFVNGRRLQEPTPIDNRDLVQFADREFRLNRQQSVAEQHTAVDFGLEEFWLFSRMQEVIEEGRLRMVYQPIVTGVNAVPVAYEALVRTDVPGWTNPVQLFEAAERLSLEGRLSERCRTEAIRGLRNLSVPGLLFLNTHPHEPLDRKLVQSLKRLRKAADGRRLVLEIHEAAVPNLSTIREFRAALKDLDIGLAYDDFGIGNSRLLELAQAPPDYLKFDRALVKDLGQTSASQTALVRTLHKHAQDLGIITLAEGLDNQTAFEACVEIGFTHFQGYLFGRPEPADEVARRTRAAAAKGAVTTGGPAEPARSAPSASKTTTR
jgi:EAL domain-containing protein (putative c-di-GMP-specific phosphodiesterase class I)